ncbi:hypothetical protein F2Q70_00013615 [Brassica cretica]|uniref:TRF2/HOY1 PH-like domain-containing protein n=1 Tax=Brassica cretica TaxID=69181 RepID=A0A8S9LZC3_BRACR|nr:hypothetical protein F2Q70_00013615 [Brassica cretica]
MVEMRPESDSAAKCRDELPVKLEIAEDGLEEEHGPLNKRSKLWSSSPMALAEPSPLGLSLRKSPSLLDLIQMRLTQSGDPKAGGSGVVKQESKCITAGSNLGPGSIEKLKASNFPATVLKIGQWEYKSRYEGDLVAKCYFAKHKLVWEVLERGLKSKIEIQWSDIVGLKANSPEKGPGTLTLLLSRQPLFFRETNPQPRKHTLWQATSDFTTDGQARNIADSSQIKVPGLQQSMSVSDFVGLLSDSAVGNHPEHMENFDSMKQQLLSDNIQFDAPPDEKSLMPSVDSLFNLLYKDLNGAANSQLSAENSVGLKSELSDLKGIVPDNNNNRVLDPASSSRPQGMLRKDSFSDLLLHLPRITSLPKFLSNISEEDGGAYNR